MGGSGSLDQQGVHQGNVRGCCFDDLKVDEFILL